MNLEVCRRKTHPTRVSKSKAKEVESSELKDYGLKRFPEGVSLTDARAQLSSEARTAARKSLLVGTAGLGLAATALHDFSSGGYGLPVALTLIGTAAIAYSAKKGMEAIVDGQAAKSLSQADLDSGETARGSILDSTDVLGKSLTQGVVLGLLVNTAALGAYNISPELGIAVTAGLAGVGATLAARSHSKPGHKLFGEGLQGTVKAALVGGGMLALCAGLGSMGSPGIHTLQGLAGGAALGLGIAAGKSSASC